MSKIRGEQRDQIVREIREKKDELDYRAWCIYSCRIDWTIDELREFQDYIDWHTYYVYCSSGQLTTKQLLEFKEKHSDWALIFEYKYVGEQLLRRFWDMLGFTSKFSWEYVFKKQHVSKQFRHRYAKLLEKYK